jgi:alpha-L-fucosidase
MKKEVRNLQDAVKRFQNWKYGLFVHYGLYSIVGRGEWVMCKERIPFEEYSELANEFNPNKDCVREWVKLAKDNGMKYVCLTTRHHDGFCLFNTATTDYNSVKTICGRDLVKEFTDACREAGLGVGIYYSVGSWEDSGFIAGPENQKSWQEFVEKDHTQLRELMTNYGQVDYLFYDGCPPPKTWNASGINAEIRRLQPDILISSRCGTEEDVVSSENHLGAHPGKLWESCFTLNNSWGYNRFDSEWKSAREVVKMLTSVAHNGGNFMLNVGPKADGAVQNKVIEVMKEVGHWLEINGEAVYGTDPSPFNYIDQEISTAKDNVVYITLHADFGPEKIITGIANKVNSITLLETNKKINFRQDNDRIFLMSLSYLDANAMPRVLKLDLDEAPQGVLNPIWHPERFRVC